MKNFLKNVLESRAMKQSVDFVEDMTVKIRNTHPAVQLGAFGVCMAALLLVSIGSFAGPPVRRSVFFFQNAKNGGVSTEVRYIPRVHGRDARLSCYVSELLLGSMQPDFIPLFNPGVRLVRCFARGHDAYIDLSSEALLPAAGVTESKKAIALFKKNVCTNFRNVDKIYVYIDGIEVYSENPYANAKAKK
ncbi:MAG TPA: GerMN domain-containing protein [Treponemataceae bacterium]|nr:GerMN domain-containing protein [Treponemataceae bacterium]